MAKIPPHIWHRVAEHVSFRAQYDLVDPFDDPVFPESGSRLYPERDLVSLMLVSKAMHDAVAPVLYRAPIVDDVGAFFRQYPAVNRDRGGSVGEGGSSISARRTRLELLHGVRELHLTLPRASSEAEVLRYCCTFVQAVLELCPAAEARSTSDGTTVPDNPMSAPPPRSREPPPPLSSGAGAPPLPNLQLVTFGRYPYPPDAYISFALAPRGSDRPGIMSVVQIALFRLLTHLRPRHVRQYVDRGPLAYCFHPEKDAIKLLQSPPATAGTPAFRPSLQAGYASLQEASRVYPWVYPSGQPDQVFQTYCLPHISIAFPLVRNARNRLVIQYDHGQRSLHDSRTEDLAVSKLQGAVTGAMQSWSRAGLDLDPGETRLEVINLGCSSMVRMRIWAKCAVYQTDMAARYPLPVTAAMYARRNAAEAERQLRAHLDSFPVEGMAKAVDYTMRAASEAAFWAGLRAAIGRNLSPIRTDAAEVQVASILSAWKERISFVYDDH